MRGLPNQLWDELKIVDVRLAVVSRQVEVLAVKIVNTYPCPGEK
jgi:hypothetical protein